LLFSAKRDQEQKTSVKYKDNVKLKHLLMSYWKHFYPNSKETQESLDVRVMHLLRQRSVITDYIKKLRVAESSNHQAPVKVSSSSSLPFRYALTYILFCDNSEPAAIITFILDGVLL